MSTERSQSSQPSSQRGVVRTRRIADAVHGTIELDDVEAALVDTKSFQRLRGVKHLGLADFVFPGATYSRFSHCVGASYITARLTENLERQGKADLGDTRLYRVAALLHDVGHYPFSHAMEDAIADHYTGELYASSGSRSGDGSPAAAILKREEVGARILKHEEVGARLIEGETDINEVLQRHNIAPSELAGIIGKKNLPMLANLVSSDLDADRIDYLLRTALHTGLPYGKVDLDYLLAMVTLDNDNQLCLDSRAMRTAEHLLLARYFDYQQVAFHKTVVAFEELLKSVLKDLMARGEPDCSTAAIETRMLDADAWLAFDDAYIWGLIRQMAEEPGEDPEVASSPCPDQTSRPQAHRMGRNLLRTTSK